MGQPQGTGLGRSPVTQSSAGQFIGGQIGASFFPASATVPPSTGVQLVHPQGGELNSYPAGQVLGGGAQEGRGPGQIGASRPAASFVAPASGVGGQMGQPQGSGFGWKPLTQASAGHAVGRQALAPPAPAVPFVPPALTPPEPMPPELPATMPPTPTVPPEPPVWPLAATPPAPPVSPPGFRPAWLTQARFSRPAARRAATPIDILNIGSSGCSPRATSPCSIAPRLEEPTESRVFTLLTRAPHGTQALAERDDAPIMRRCSTAWGNWSC